MGIIIIGTGRAALGHAVAAVNCKLDSLVAVLGATKDDAKALLAKLPPTHVVTVEAAAEADYDHYLARGEVTHVIVSCAMSSHSLFVSRALVAMKHVLVERPVAETVEETTRLLHFAQEKKLTLLVGYRKRYDQSFRHLYMLSRDKLKVGHPMVVRISSRIGELRSSVTDEIPTIGGVFHSLTAGDIDLAMWIVGEAPCRMFSCSSGVADAYRKKKMDDTAVVALQFPSGTICLIDNSLHSSYGSDQRVEVLGTNAMLIVENPSKTITRLSDGSGTHTTPLPDDEERFAAAFVTELDVFLRESRGEGHKQFRTMPNEVVDNLRLVMQAVAFSSERTGVSVGATQPKTRNSIPIKTPFEFLPVGLPVIPDDGTPSKRSKKRKTMDSSEVAATTTSSAPTLIPSSVPQNQSKEEVLAIFDALNDTVADTFRDADFNNFKYPRYHRVRNDQRKVRVAVFGLGRMGRVRAKAVLENPHAVLVVGFDVVEACSLAFARDFNGVRIALSPEDALGDDVDAVLVSTISSTHREVIELAAKRGKHIFCEKPIALGLEQTMACVKTCDDNNVLLYCGLQRRSDKHFGEMHRAVRSGDLGTLELVRVTSRDHATHNTMSYLASSGGYWYDSIIHDLDMVRYLLGGRDPVEVFALGHAFIPEVAASGDIDSIAIVLRYDDGSIATIDNNRRAFYGYDQRAEVYGSKGMMQVGFDHNTTIYNCDSFGMAHDNLTAGLTRYAEAYKEEINHFVNCLVGNQPAKNVRVLPHELVCLAAVADACEKSQKTGVPIRVEYPTNY